MKKTSVLVLGLILVLVQVNLTRAAHPAPGGEEIIVARIFDDGSGKLAYLAGELDVWEAHPADGYLVAALTPAQQKRLIQQGIKIEADAALSGLLTAPLHPAQVEGGIPGYPCYRTVEETDATLDQLAAAYPEFAQVVDIGDSWEKATPGSESGYDLHILRLTSPLGGAKPRLILVAEIHAREYATAETALRFAELLLQNYGVDPDITWLLDYNEIDILPMANPDGRKKAETGMYWRKNTHEDLTCPSSAWGVDLNRNSSFQWGGAGSSNFPCDETYRGEAPASEPETQALQNFLASQFPDRRGPGENDPAPPDTEGLLVSLHSFGGLVLWPYGWTPTAAPNQVQLETLGGKLAYYNFYIPQQAYTLYPTSGIIDDWAYGELGLPAYTIEMGNNFFESCPFFETSIWPNNRDALLYAFKAARRPYQDPAGPEITGLQLSVAAVGAGQSPLLIAMADDTRNTAMGVGPGQAIQAARYSIDSPSWVPGSSITGLNPQDGTFDSSVEMLTGEVDSDGLSVGKHTLFIEAQDASGVWGVPSAIFLTILPDYAVQLSPVAQNQSALPGAQAIYYLTIRNVGAEPDAFNLGAASPEDWETTILPDSTPTLTSGETVAVEVRVHVPANTAGGTSAATTLTITSTSHSQSTASGTLTTFASYGIFLPAVLK